MWSEMSNIFRSVAKAILEEASGVGCTLRKLMLKLEIQKVNKDKRLSWKKKM